MQDSLSFNGTSSDAFNIIVDQPTVTFAKRKVYSSSVTGMNGNYYDFQNAWEEKIVSYKILAGNDEATNYETFIQIAEWLNDTDGYAILTDSFDPEHYHFAVCIDGMDAIMDLQYYGKTTIRFRCKPERYLVTEPIEVTSGDSVNNPTNHIAYPLITLTGGGVPSLLELENKTMQSTGILYNATQMSQVIQRQKDYNQIWRARRIDATTVQQTGSNYGAITSAVDSTGVLEFEINSSSYSQDWGVGYCLKVDSNSDYSISCEAYKSGILEVYFISNDAYNPITSSMFVNSTGSDWVPLELSFKTPAECGYIYIIFAQIGTSSPALTTQKFRNIMVNRGKEPQPFRSYSAVTPTSVLKINGTELTITEAFSTAIIDCEKENVTIDGSNGNPVSRLTDQYGNLSASYLQMIVGANAITYSGDITAVTIEPRFWVL